VRTIVAGPPRTPDRIGTREGTIYAGPSAYPFSLAVDASGVTLTLPSMGIDAAKAVRVVSDQRQLAFDLPLAEGDIRLEGRWKDGWLIGTLTVPSLGTGLLMVPPQ